MGLIWLVMSHIKNIWNPYMAHRLSHIIPIYGPYMSHTTQFGKGCGPWCFSRKLYSSWLSPIDVCCTDIWRYLHPSSSTFTWTKADGSLSPRIDLISCPYIWVVSVSACHNLPCPFSNHCTVVLPVSVPSVVPRGPGLWNFNVSVLEERVFSSYLDWKRSPGWLESWEGLLLLTDVSTTKGALSVTIPQPLKVQTIFLFSYSHLTHEF